ncbi:hypothetical protein LX69_00727 [Breznakibacter xylanolyticus]|uniref:ParE-like toxin of type II ParDE toxin-antitoxin system n=1 Tax=Breznakibacter xylanolyticus TaxID=990 RepID=A0A2W7NHY4_9BACT|nr:hypothetical protein [Breznakibacter xylanolyticus]PZX19460.1 hypothetical protein LX69_00727 [Breznakibacter xylanolyticus]
MIYTIVYNPRLYDDVKEAVEWYNDHHPGLGDEFMTLFKRKSTLLANCCHLFAVRYHTVRCMPMGKFPYLIHYRIDNAFQLVVVEGVVHTSRNPDKGRQQNSK